ncbi:LysR family transcriptional regulator [Kiloniella laminariae]|uniref:LysR family transcriptional regulator n=1 Tax=Kiloniella laminariae TaxID=454162 RepID=A0ABT4LFG8_9PROT|nr:LysR family transcriptional regulator [Kiloniella laminariae]MCZ4279846.1 LysR family transcriptional regulator [Kiloniella laminariae]
MINPLHIATFLSLHKTRHFTRTAEDLNMTQPGVTLHLQRLERELDVSLFARRGKTMELTPDGETFLRFARKQQKAEKELRDSLGEDSPFCGECRITCSGSMATRLYPALLQLQEHHRELRISLEAAPDATAVDLIKKNLMDLGLITSFIEDPQINITRIGHEELCLALPAHHTGVWADLLSLGYIDHPNGAHYASQVLEKNYPREFSGFADLPQKGYINQLSQILLPVSEGLGFTVLPESTVDLFPDQKRICKASLAVPCRETLYLITKKHRPLPNRYQLIRSCIDSLLSSGTAAPRETNR